MLKDITGKKFNRLTAISYLNGKWLCKCDCGSETYVTYSHLICGNTKSCGCLKRDRFLVHGYSNTPTYTTWSMMQRRCYDIGNNRYKYYGGRGIKVCERWLEDGKGFSNFLEDMGERPKGKTLDRIDVNGDYELSNCMWSDSITQARNKSNTILTEELVAHCKELLNGSKTSIKQLARELGINYHTLYKAIKGVNWSMNVSRQAEEEVV